MKSLQLFLAILRVSIEPLESLDTCISFSLALSATIARAQELALAVEHIAAVHGCLGHKLVDKRLAIAVGACLYQLLRGDLHLDGLVVDGELGSDAVLGGCPDHHPFLRLFACLLTEFGGVEEKRRHDVLKDFHDSV